jgi:hypothetical protein
MKHCIAMENDRFILFKRETFFLHIYTSFHFGTLANADELTMLTFDISRSPVEKQKNLYLRLKVKFDPKKKLKCNSKAWLHPIIHAMKTNVIAMLK